MDIPLTLRALRDQLRSGRRLAFECADGLYYRLYWDGKKRQYIFVKGYHDALPQLQVEFNGLKRALMVLLNEFGQME
jgi:hypothetical protein